MATRFAGSAPITDFLDKSINMGAVAQKAAEQRSALKNAGTELAGEVGAAGIEGQGRVEAAGILGAAQASAAQGQMMGSLGSMIGKVGGQAIEQFGGGGGGSSMPSTGSISGAWDRMHGSTNPFNKVWDF